MLPVAERPATAFLLGGIEIPVETSSTALTVIPNQPSVGAVATTRRAFEASEQLEHKAGAIATQRYSWQAKALSDFASYPLILGGALGTFAGVGALVDGTGVGVVAALLAGAAASGVVCAAVEVVSSLRAKWALRRELGRDVATMKEAVEATSGVEKAWLVNRANACLAAIDLPAENSPYPFRTTLARNDVRQELAALASTPVEVGLDDQRDIASLQKICALVFESPSARHVTSPGTIRGSVGSNLEQVIDLIDTLSERARSLIPQGLRDAVVAELSRDPGNRWRIQRFSEACEGKRTAYSSQVPDVAEPSIQEALSAAGAFPADHVHATTETAVRAMSARILGNDRRAVCVATSAIAEQVGAYFEAKGMRAVLYERPAAGGIVVTVYAPDVSTAAKNAAN